MQNSSGKCRSKTKIPRPGHSYANGRGAAFILLLSRVRTCSSTHWRRPTPPAPHRATARPRSSACPRRCAATSRSYTSASNSGEYSFSSSSLRSSSALSVPYAVQHQPAHDLVRLTEGQALLYQIIGRVGGVGEAAAGRASCASLLHGRWWCAASR